MKKTLGYGFKLTNESYEEALAMYGSGGLLESKELVAQEIALAKNNTDIPKNARPRIFKVVVELLE